MINLRCIARSTVRLVAGLWLVGLLIGGQSGPAAEPVVDPKELPRLPAVPLDQAINTFEIKPGFRLELAAHEPQVVDPVTVAFDETGRMFAVEMRDYSERRDEQPHLGTIRLLEDGDGDGRFEKATVYADDLPWPTAVICWDGGIFVAASPDILWFKDTDGDGRADERKVVFTGFGATATRLNMQALVNGFNWGLDNRIHGATAGNGGTITSPVNPKMKPLNLHGRDFSFDPRTLELRAEGPTAQYGVSFDSRGRKFSSSNSRHIMAEMYPPQHAGLNPHYNLPPALVDIAADGPAAEVFRISPDEPWRIVRTRWRIAGVVKGVVEGGGRVSGYFTGATGLTIYRGNAYGPEFVDNAFIGDAGGNLVHRKIIKTDGVTLTARRPEDEQKREFLASRDTWFRPVQFANAPDGCLYVIDMHRETIEHPWSIPEPIKQHVDLNSGNDRGRVYRIAPEGFRQPPPPRLGKASTAELVATLVHPNGWHRDTAARLLFERRDRATIPLLERSLADDSLAAGHSRALQALVNLGALKPSHLTAAWQSTDAGARQWAVRLAGHNPELFREAFVSHLAKLTTDPDAWVRYETALVLGVFPQPDHARWLLALLEADGADTWMQAAVLRSTGGLAVELLEQLITRRSAKISDAHLGALLEPLAKMAAARPVARDTARIFEMVSKLADPAQGFRFLRAYSEGWRPSPGSRTKADTDNLFATHVRRAMGVALDQSAPAATRAEAIRLVAAAGKPADRSAMLGLIGGEVPVPVQSAALGAITVAADVATIDTLLERLASLTGALQTELIRSLLGRIERTAALLTAMEQGRVKTDALSTSQVAQLRSHRDKTIAERVAKLFPITTQGPASALANFQPALQLPGDPAKGRLIYQTRCASCHRAGSEGYPVGPDLVTMKAMGREKLLVSILDPNREVAPQFIAFQVEKKDGEGLLAVVVSETGTTVTLRMPSGLETTLQRAEIVGMRSEGQSMMPEGMEAGLLIPDMADLLAFIEAQ